MKLISLSIKKLYDYYDYEVNFNPDITFLYGHNGCGKTTILNIIDAIISGQLEKLFKFQFKSIVLQYQINTELLEDDKISNNSIKIKKDDDKMTVEMEKTKNVFSQRFFAKKAYHLSFWSDEREKHYFECQQLLEKIKNMFSYVYLPLSRVSSENDNYTSYHNTRKRHRGREIYEIDYADSKVYKDKSMRQVETIILKESDYIAREISIYNDTFRNSLLKSFLEFDIPTFINEKNGTLELEFPSSKDLTKIKNSYISILNELNILEEGALEKFETSFQEIITVVNNLEMKSSFIEGKSNILMHIKDILKIQKIVKHAEKLETRKAKIKKPIEMFLETINGFINSSGEKKIFISPFGEIYFTTEYDEEHKEISLLSSGEKQLISFFANLIFTLKESAGNIFISDEPELSLHLSWQKKFVEKALAINPDIQLIFATHAPELIGKYKNRMVELKKKKSSKRK